MPTGSPKRNARGAEKRNENETESQSQDLENELRFIAGLARILSESTTSCIHKINRLSDIRRRKLLEILGSDLDDLENP